MRRAEGHASNTTVQKSPDGSRCPFPPVAARGYTPYPQVLGQGENPCKSC